MSQLRDGETPQAPLTPLASHYSLRLGTIKATVASAIKATRATHRPTMGLVGGFDESHAKRYNRAGIIVDNGKSPRNRVRMGKWRKSFECA